MTERDATPPPDHLQSVAIIGLAGRFPGARNVREFWANLCAGVESVTRFSDAELEDNFGAEVHASSNFVKARPILENVDQFDAGFFAMYAREAELTDPQQRVFLECCWEAFEDAAYDPAEVRGAIGVFGGSSPSTYFLHNVLANRGVIDDFTSSYQVGNYPMLVGSGPEFLATRVSYKLDLRGPSMSMQTACSTSLLAVAKACQSLLLYESDMALAGGVSITFPQKRGYQHLEGGMVSADGSCRPFDADASGTVFGSGAGVVLLKRLEDALRDGDQIYAVIRGSGVNNDGASKVGYTAPSVSGQAAVIEMALATADVDARSISYVECHGTATPLGDPIEIAGLTQAFRAGTQDTQFCAIGSVKGNVGHLDAAAGITGLIKTALALKYRVLPPSLHYRRPNPRIDFASSPFFVNAALGQWPEGSGPRRAGVSAFGVGGTNVHVVLEEHAARPTPADALAGQPQLLVLSARSPAALGVMRRNLAAALRAAPPPALRDVAYSLQVGRRRFDERFALVASDAMAAISRLDTEQPASASSATAASTGSRVVFMFPGQGAQYPNMGRDLYEREPEFRRRIERCALILQPLIGEKFLQLLYPNAATSDAAQRLTATSAAQPAIFAVEYALAHLWMSWGIKPAAMIGHSIGEFVAAVLAGVMSLDDALAVVAERGRLMQSLPGGAMLAVRRSESEIRSLLPDGLSIAAINGPALCVVAGPFATMDEFEKLLVARDIVSRRLHTSHAFHSTMVDPVIAPLERRLAAVQLSPPKIPYVSSVTGTWVQSNEATSGQYWARHARETVRFADGLATLCEERGAVLLEVGPGNVLSTLALQCTRGRNIPVVTSMQGSERSASDTSFVLEAVGRLWCAGVTPDWRAIHGSQAARVSLPTYPFERARYWIDAPNDSTGAIATSAADNNRTLQDINEMTTSALDPINDIKARIAAIFEDLSGEKPESEDASTTFLEMGYDSLFLTQVAQKLQSQMGVKITFRQLLGDYDTIPALAAFLVDKLPQPLTPVRTVIVATPAPIAATVAALPSSTPSLPLGSGLEAVMREQLQAMTHLMNQQFELLRARTQQEATATAPAITATPAVPASAPVAPGAAEAPASEAQTTPSRFDVFGSGKKGADSGLSAEHRRHIDTLVTRYTAKTAGSKRETAAYRRVSADPRAAAGFRSEWKEMVYPIVVNSSKGSKLYDVDGNEYIDLVNGYGQTAFGHAPDFVVQAVKTQLEAGFAIGPQSELTGKVAALFAEMTGNERVTFCNTGSEAVMAAMRVARTVTGREKIVIFNGDYHGQFDEVLVKGVQRSGAAPRSMTVAPGIPKSAIENMIVLEYGAASSTQWIREHAHELAAVIVEPVQSRRPDLRPFEFLREIRAITETSGTAFVMDEVVTGFRVHPGGMQHVIGIRADLATYGKVVGGGLPVGVLAGKAKFMDALDGGDWNYGDASYPETGVTFFAGTFVRHPLLLASAWAVLNHMKAHGAQLQENLNARTSALVERLTALFSSRGLATHIESYASWFYFNIHNEHPLATLLYYHLRERGIHIQDGFACFLTTAHSDSDFEKIYAAFESSVDELQAAGIFVNRSAPETAAPRSLPATGADQPAAGAPVPLTENQNEIWLAAQLSDDASCAFNESVTLRFRGRLQLAALASAMTFLIARHDALRARFSATGEEVSIAEPYQFQFPVTDLSSEPQSENEAAYAKLLAQDAGTAFDLISGPPIRAHLVQFAADSYAFMLTAHHIVCDGWSLNVIVGELAEAYASFCRGATPVLPPALQYSSYARSQAARDPSEAAATENYWLNEFHGRVPTLELPTDRPRPAMRSFNGTTLSRRIDATLYQSVKKAGARQRSTLFVTLLSAFQVLMGRLANQTDVIVGVPTAGQALIEDKVLVGHCVNFLPMRGTWDGKTTVSAYLATQAKQVLDAYEHQNYTFGTLVKKLQLRREQGRLPLTELQFNLERLPDRIELPDLDIAVEPNAKARVNFDLFMNVIESSDGLRIDCDFNTDLYDASTIEVWLDAYRALLESIVADAQQPVCRASMLSAREHQRLLIDLNDTSFAYPADKGVHELIEAQARATPDAIAAQFGDATLTYAALDVKSNQLAHVIRQRIQDSRRSGKLVGVSVDRSLGMLVSLIAVLKAGLAYVPLDPTHPAARLRHILGEADVAAFVCDSTQAAKLVGADVPVVHLTNDSASIAAAPPTAPTRSAAATDLAYVIYTSGSTGLPKGVEVSHRAVVNLLTSMARLPGLSSRDVLCAVTTVSFDIAALELFLPLVVGAKLVIVDRDSVIDGYRLLNLMKQSRATVLQATPAGWRLLLEAGFRAGSGFKMLCGGEALPKELANRLLEGSGELWNMYGPTETTIWSACVRIPAGDAPITVGTPIANTQFYILDRFDQPMPSGVAGQLHIGGAGVAEGYYKRADLTLEKFVANPFAEGRMYRTGDLARWLPGGGLQVLGRIDHQVKLRGFRIELGEIEAVLMRTGAVSAAAVLVRDDMPGTPKLVAYYVENPTERWTHEQLSDALAEHLPDYMIPTAYVRLESLPVSPNGKLDRSALPLPASVSDVAVDETPPTTATEVTLTKIFGEVLRMDNVGINADLLRLGADSLQLFQITARANRAGIKITAKQLLARRTAKALAALADQPVEEIATAAGGSALPALSDYQRSRRSSALTRR